MKRRRNILLALILVSGLLATGCAEGKEEQKDLSGDAETVLEVYVWADEAENVQLLSDAYMEKHPDISVHINSIPISEYRQRMMALKNGGEQADCIFMSNTAEADVWKNKHMLKNMDVYLSGTEGHYEQWFQSGEEDCASYMLPYRKSRWAVYYNKDIFDRMGIAYPQEDWTWEEYGQMAQRLTGWLDGRRVYGSLSFEVNSTWWRVPARTAGANDPFVVSDLEKFKESLEWIYHLTYDLGAQEPYSAQAGSGLENDYDAVFLEGNTAMYFSGDWSAAVLNEAIRKQGSQIEYDIAPLPHWEGEEGYVLSDAAVVSMLEQTEHPEETFDYMWFVAGEEGAGILAEHNLIPAWNTEEVRELYLNSEEMPQHREYFFQEGSLSMVPAKARYTAGMEIMKKEAALYLQQQQDIEQTFDNIEKGLNAVR